MQAAVIYVGENKLPVEVVKFAHQATWRISNSEEIAAYIPTGEPGECPIPGVERFETVESSPFLPNPAEASSSSLVPVVAQFETVESSALPKIVSLHASIGTEGEMSEVVPLPETNGDEHSEDGVRACVSMDENLDDSLEEINEAETPKKMSPELSECTVSVCAKENLDDSIEKQESLASTPTKEDTISKLSSIVQNLQFKAQLRHVSIDVNHASVRISPKPDSQKSAKVKPKFGRKKNPKPKNARRLPESSVATPNSLVSCTESPSGDDRGLVVNTNMNCNAADVKAVSDCSTFGEECSGTEEICNSKATKSEETVGVKAAKQPPRAPIFTAAKKASNSNTSTKGVNSVMTTVPSNSTAEEAATKNVKKTSKAEPKEQPPATTVPSTGEETAAKKAKTSRKRKIKSVSGEEQPTEVAAKEVKTAKKRKTKVESEEELRKRLENAAIQAVENKFKKKERQRRKLAKLMVTSVNRSKSLSTESSSLESMESRVEKHIEQVCVKYDVKVSHGVYLTAINPNLAGPKPGPRFAASVSDKPKPSLQPGSASGPCTDKSPANKPLSVSQPVSASGLVVGHPPSAKPPSTDKSPANKPPLVSQPMSVSGLTVGHPPSTNQLPSTDKSPATSVSQPVSALGLTVGCPPPSTDKSPAEKPPSVGQPVLASGLDVRKFSVPLPVFVMGLALDQPAVLQSLTSSGLTVDKSLPAFGLTANQSSAMQPVSAAQASVSQAESASGQALALQPAREDSQKKRFVPPTQTRSAFVVPPLKKVKPTGGGSVSSHSDSGALPGSSSSAESSSSNLSGAKSLGASSQASSAVDSSSTLMWIECTLCGKWRLQPDSIEPCKVYDHWTCAMNSDPKYNDCSVPQGEVPNPADDEEYVETSFVPGSIVWAKMDGYPWWPGMIEEDPNQGIFCRTLSDGSVGRPIAYHVVFFDTTVNRSWIAYDKVRLFSERDDPNQGKPLPKKYRRLERLVQQAGGALQKSLKERLELFSFSKRHRQQQPGDKGKKPLQSGKGFAAKRSRQEFDIGPSYSGGAPVVHDVTNNDPTRISVIRDLRVGSLLSHNSDPAEMRMQNTEGKGETNGGTATQNHEE